MEAERVDAKRAGKVTYKTALLCPFKHPPRRYVANGACVECSIERAKVGNTRKRNGTKHDV